ncbi:MAG: dipeptidyl-peptidase 3 family protein [Gemmatimonadales bacterium]
MRLITAVGLGLGISGLGACGAPAEPPVSGAPSLETRLARYTEVALEADTAVLTSAERRMVPLLVEASKAMDDAYWLEMYPARDSLLAAVRDSTARRLIVINFGPWDRLDGDAPFIEGVPPRPPGAGYYPAGADRTALESAIAAGGPAADSLKSLYTIVRRDSAGRFTAIPYPRFFATPYARAVPKLREAAAIAADAAFRRYLELLASALETGGYRDSDLAWMDSKTSGLELVLGPIETYDDQLFGYKASHEGYVLVKDKVWSARLARYAGALPALQRALPVPDAYRRETPGSDAELNAYDVLFVAGQANAGVKTIAINLPNDEEVQLRKGTRRLQLKNAMRAKFERILLPIAHELIGEEQLGSVQFDPFFENVMFHEVAHGLGIKRTLDSKGTVREALKEKASALEEGKADILGLYMIRQLRSRGALGSGGGGGGGGGGGSMDRNYVTFLASIFRSVRFGASSAHGRANVVAFNFLGRQGAFTRGQDGRYRVDAARFQAGADSLAARILRLQGDGDYAGVAELEREFGTIGTGLRADLDRLGTLGIPVDLIYRQRY